MATYMTKQRKILLDYLSRNSDKQLSAEDIFEGLRAFGLLENISLSAVYRNLAELESGNMVRRSSMEGQRKVLYQYVGAEKCRNELHLACKKCGKTIHVDHKVAEALIENIAEIQEFTIDKKDTVLYGTCKECNKGASVNK